MIKSSVGFKVLLISIIGVAIAILVISLADEYLIKQHSLNWYKDSIHRLNGTAVSRDNLAIHWMTRKFKWYLFVNTINVAHYTSSTREAMTFDRDGRLLSYGDNLATIDEEANYKGSQRLDIVKLEQRAKHVFNDFFNLKGFALTDKGEDGCDFFELYHLTINNEIVDDRKVSISINKYTGKVNGLSLQYEPVTEVLPIRYNDEEVGKMIREQNEYKPYGIGKERFLVKHCEILKRRNFYETDFERTDRENVGILAPFCEANIKLDLVSNTNVNTTCSTNLLVDRHRGTIIF